MLSEVTKSMLDKEWGRQSNTMKRRQSRMTRRHTSRAILHGLPFPSYPMKNGINTAISLLLAGIWSK